MEFEKVVIEKAVNEGKCLTRVDQFVLFTERTVPGDVVDLEVRKKKKNYADARVTRFHERGPDYIQPFCQHFEFCGGCKWQQLKYDAQLKMKQTLVSELLHNIGKVELPEMQPILGSERITAYRNKIEYSFTHRKWVPDLAQLDTEEHRAAGYHISGRFDKVMEIKTCHLQDELGNAIRDFITAFALAHNYTFFNLRDQTGFLRNMILRNTIAGDWMLILCFHADEPENRIALLDAVKEAFPQIVSLCYVINEKRNDTITDLPVQLYHGVEYLSERLGALQFKISPKAFFQVNVKQAIRMYDAAKAMAGLTENDIVYDLYTGTGSIACYIASECKKVVGLEYVPEAIEDAKVNAALNGIGNTDFFAGDIKDLLTTSFFAEHGYPDVVITDPPRTGMHEDVVMQLLQAAPRCIVYISCNAATQARDLFLLKEKYDVKAVQPVDMFPHTSHIENIVKLEFRKEGL